VIAPLALVLALLAQDPDPVLQEIETQEWSLIRGFVNRTYDIGVSYYQQGYRQEAIWFFQRTLELVPKNGQLRGFVNLIQDFDNPAWKKKQWKNPTKGVDAGFRKQAAAWEDECGKFLMQIGRFAAAKKGDVARAKAKEYFLHLLELTGGPFEVGPDRLLRAGKAGSIPQPLSDEIVKNDLIRINGQLYFRDAMLRAIPNADAVNEAKGKHFLVRVEGPGRKAEDLLGILEQAYPHYVAVTGQEAMKPLGVLVLADRASYERVCKESGNADFALAAGFMSGKLGFAVTFDGPSLEEVAVHEGAHLFHSVVFRSSMPSWYDEGFACTFAHGGTLRVADGKLETRRPMDRARLEAILQKKPPLSGLLAGNAVDRINANDGSSDLFYAQAWALYTFLRNTKDPKLAPRFQSWEGFCLGAGYEKAKDGKRGAELFQRVFGDAMAELEKGLSDWIGAQVGGGAATK
jgi:hypothetical protein